MRQVTRLAASCAMSLLFADAPALAATCNQAKLTAAGKNTASTLLCYARAVNAQASLDARCLERADGAFVAAFSKAEQRADCATVGDVATVEATVDACVATLASQLDTSSSPPGSAPCVVAKLRATGNMMRAKIKCHVRVSHGGGAPDPACLDGAERSLSVRFAKAELRGGCATTGDAENVANTVDACVTNILNDLPPPSSTTPTTSTTSTTVVSPCVGTEPAALAGVTAAHNAVRAAASPVPTPPLAPLCWNASVASVAQSWADACTWRHNPNLSNLGENIAAFGGNHSVSAGPDAVNFWAEEASDYQYSSNSCSGVCGHYTQIVWRSTTEVGCGVRVCTTGSPFDSHSGATWTMVVCDYRPPGNFRGQRPY
jgi:pathogenesis-related protein 1